MEAATLMIWPQSHILLMQANHLTQPQSWGGLGEGSRETMTLYLLMWSVSEYRTGKELEVSLTSCHIKYSHRSKSDVEVSYSLFPSLYVCVYMCLSVCVDTCIYYTHVHLYMHTHTHIEREILRKSSHAIIVFRSGMCRAGQEGRNQAWVTTAVLRQNYFWKPQFFLVQIFSWLDEAHSCYWGCWGGENFSPTLPELFWLIW